MNQSQAPYRMRLSLNVLQHLGLRLYSNVPAVLSEVVAKLGMPMRRRSRSRSIWTSSGL